MKRLQIIFRGSLVLVCLCLGALMSGASAQKAQEELFYLVRTINVGGDGGWDYLFMDNDARRLYVSHATHVVVIDPDSGRVVGDIPNTNGVHGVAIDADAGRGFVSNGRDSSVLIFDLKTRKEIGRVRVQRNPDAIVYDPATARVFAFNRGSSSVSVIDAKGGTVVSTLALGGHPEFAVSDRKGMMYVNLDDKNEVAAIDAKEMKIKARYALAPGEEPSGMAMDRENGRLFVVCANKKMIMMDAGNGRVVSTAEIGEGTDAAAFDPSTKLAFSSNGEGTLTVVREESPERCLVVGTVKTERGARTMTLDEKTHHLFLATAKFGPAPAPSAERPHPRAPIVPGSFVVLEYAPR